MFLQIILIILSLAGGASFYWWVIPAILRKDNIFLKILDAPYSFFEKFLPSPEITYYITISFIISFFIWIALEIIYFSTKEKRLTNHGAARWANSKDVEDLIDSKGVVLGRLNGKILRTDKTHLITCAGTRSGKGVGAIIPTLLEYPDSLVCLDIKGENYKVTARRRKEFCKVFVLNPFDVKDIPTNSYNWLDSIDLNDPSCGDKALRIASILVGGSSDDGIENHFNEQAKRLLQGVILLVCGEKKELRNMLTVAQLIHKTPLPTLCEVMIEKGYLAFGLVGTIGAQFSNNPNERELGGILSTSQRATNNLDNPQISKTLKKSDFDISRLPDEKMSIYLVIPADKVSDFKDYIKVFFELTFSSLTSRKKPIKYPVLFLFDEVAQLGYIDSFAKLITLIKGMGGQFWFFFQSIGQLRSIYGKNAETILSNATQIFYGCNDLDTAKLISESLGDETVREYKNRGEYHDFGKPLLSPSEVRQLPVETPIILMTGKPPIKVKRLTYYKDKEYKGLFDPNPYIQ